MEWTFLFLIAVVIAVHWFDYSRAVHEYTFAQPELDGLAAVIGEKTPIVVEIGPLPWRPTIAEKMRWSCISAKGEEAEKESIDFQTWLTTREDIDHVALAHEVDIETGLTEIAAAKQLWWLPGLVNTSVDILKPSEIVGLSWVSAEREWIGCSSGEPVLLWLVHARYRRFLPEDTDINPWNLTVETAPYIGRVQYIEVVLKPGWAIGLPSHWGYAARNSSESDAWIWMSEQHSPLSFALTKVASISH